MSTEELWYEASPYTYALAGLVVLFALPGVLATVCGAFLVVAGVTILRMRWSYRRRLADATQALAKSTQRSAVAGDIAKDA